MARSGGNAQRQLFTLIRDFATEKSQGERRVSDLKKCLQDLRSELDKATVDLEDAKRSKEESEHDLKGCEVELSMADASILAQQARTRLLQDEISKVGDDVASLKNEGGALRDEFISRMYEFNKRIRKFKETMTHPSRAQISGGISYGDCEMVMYTEGLTQNEDVLEDIKVKIAYTNAQILAMEQEYQEALCAQEEVLQVIKSMERRAFLVESLMEEMKSLQELSKYTADEEKSYAYLGEELMKRYTCPNCGLNNMGTLAEGDN